MYPLHGATRECSNRMNYLMCYFCSPQQYDWYDRGANVCASFCQTVYEHCQLARFRGKQIGEAYSTGNEFCKGQHFHVVDSNAKCFQFDKTVFSQGMRHTSTLTALG